jgi:hypothetical protein
MVPPRCEKRTLSSRVLNVGIVGEEDVKFSRP